ncbi:MAG: M4 family metallopeptidase [Deltaproteobacteria bacterium]|nr:M4 family metallopeptidase [Deltaproteobacteria bacterium]
MRITRYPARDSWLLLGSLTAITTFAGCVPEPTEGSKNDTDDIAAALAAMPEAQVLQATPDGVPVFIVGEMGKTGGMQDDDAVAAEGALRPALPPVLAAFRLKNDDLTFRKMSVDEQGERHFRYAQKHAGLDVIGADLVVHVDVKGAISAVNGTARGDISPLLGANPISEAQARSSILGDNRLTGLATGAMRTVYIETDDGKMHKAFEAIVAGARDGGPVRDKVYVDLDTGAIVADYPQIFHAESRKVYSSNNGTTTPGTLKRTEGQAATSDVDVNAAYDNTGNAYEAYKAFFGRDSYDGAGAALISSVHYSSNYCNAYWDGTQMVYGDGSASQGCSPLARSNDVTAHELTHAVTERESQLNYSGESGGMNEAMSDIFASFVEAWTDGGKTGTLAVSANTWLVGEKVIAPALRYMCDPAKDGASADYYSSSVGNLDVHYSSGLGNLAFCLLSQGGTHPRGKSTLNVTGIGLEKAIRIMYKAQTDYITSTSKYAAIRTAMEQATTALGYDQATKDSVSCAWAAIGVGSAPTSCGAGGGGGGGGGGGTSDGTLTNNVPVSSLAAATGTQTFYQLVVPSGQASLSFTTAGGSGDVDMYVQVGSKPSTSTYLCKSEGSATAETCTISNPAAGTYFVLLNAYAAYSGVTLTGKYTAPTTGGDPYLTNGVAVTSISGATGTSQYWRVTLPAAKTLTVKISGGTGDADLYVRSGSRPTTTTYACRPYLNGNAETCTISNTVAGDYYVMVRSYAAFTGLSLLASY